LRFASGKTVCRTDGEEMTQAETPIPGIMRFRESCALKKKKTLEQRRTNRDDNSACATKVGAPLAAPSFGQGKPCPYNLPPWPLWYLLGGS